MVGTQYRVVAVGYSRRSGWSISALEALDAAASERIPTQCVAYPLARRGERFPFLCPAAERFFVPEPGDPLERYAACLEGVTLVERFAYDVLDGVAGTSGGDVFSTGGGSRSDVWMQCRPARPESAFGTAILAAAGSRYEGLTEAIERMVRIERNFRPNGTGFEPYEAVYGRFRAELEERGYG